MCVPPNHDDPTRGRPTFQQMRGNQLWFNWHAELTLAALLPRTCCSHLVLSHPKYRNGSLALW